MMPFLEQAFTKCYHRSLRGSSASGTSLIFLKEILDLSVSTYIRMVWLSMVWLEKKGKKVHINSKFIVAQGETIIVCLEITVELLISGPSTRDHVPGAPIYITMSVEYSNM